MSLKPAGVAVLGAIMACLLAAAAAAPLASAQTAATLGVPPVCLVDATGKKTTVTKEMCGITVSAGTFLSPTLPAEYGVGTHRITWNGLTDAGLRMSETQVIIVMDLTPPDITAPPAILGLEATAKETVLTASELGDATVIEPSLKDKRNDARPSPVGSHTVTWTAEDNSGLVATATQAVQIADTTKPTIACDDVRIKSKVPAPQSVAKLSAEFFDRVDGTKTLTPPASAPDPLPHGKKTTVTYALTDAAGNKADSCTQNAYVLYPSALATLPPGGIEGSTFGSAIAFGANTLFVGDPGHDHTTTSGTPTTMPNSGIVYAYSLGEGPKQYAGSAIAPATPATDLNFGSALAVIQTDDGEVLAVGAPGKGTNEGEVHLYDIATDTFEVIQNPNPASSKSDHFGAALAPMGDKLVVAAHMYDQPATDTATKKRDSGRVYVYDSDGDKQYEIPHPAPTKDGRFGSQVEATVEMTADGRERVYVGARAISKEAGAQAADTEPKVVYGAVYVYDVTKAKTTGIVTESTFLRPSGSDFTEFATEQIRPTGGGGAYVGEPGISTGGKIHKFAPGGARNEVTPLATDNKKFGASFDTDDHLLYAGTQKTGAAQPLRAFSLEDHTYRDVYHTAAPAGYYSERFAHTLEASGDWVAAAEILEQFSPSDDLVSKSHVKLLDLRTMDPDIIYPEPASIIVPAPASPGQSRALPGAPQPAQPQATQVLEAPKLLSTELLGTGKIKLTYDTAIDRLEVDRDDYVMSDASLEVMAVDVSGSTITLTYAGGGPSGAGTEPPGVVLVGGIGHY